MDLNSIINELKDEQEQIAEAIRTLEILAPTGQAKGARTRLGIVRTRSTRGRKFMDAADRLEVSERMKRYWAGRRQGTQMAFSAVA